MGMGGSNRNNEGKQRLGIRDPISLAGPTEQDVLRTLELEKFLEDAGLYETRDEGVRRQEVLGRLDEVVKIWVKTISRAKGLNERLVEESNALIFSFGSYRLGVHGPGADIDTLCVGPRYATREEDFFGQLHRMLLEMPEVTELHPVPDAHVPVMKFKLSGVSIDLVYARLTLWVIPQDLDLSQGSILENAVDEQTVRSLNGCRVTDRILRLVPNIQNFRTTLRCTLRCMRLWAKRRSVYSNVTGFLGGINWALLVAHVCQLYPNALPNTLVCKFFRVYTHWHWPNPVMLCDTEKGSLRLQVWDPRQNTRGKSDLMPIITPAYPSMNSSYNVSSSTLRIMSGEFRRGNEICEAMEAANKADWDTLCESYAFFEEYKNYLQIDVSATNADDFRKWKGWVESRFRYLTLKLERDTYDMLQCHPHPGDLSDKSRPFHGSYFMGLGRKQGVPVNEGGQYFDIRIAVAEFKHCVNQYKLLKPGMEIRVSHLKRSNIPNFVFPGGVRPLRRRGGSGQGKSTDLDHGSDGGGGQKRKRVDDNVEPENSRYAKSLHLCSGEVREAASPPPISNVKSSSSCSTSTKCESMALENILASKDELEDDSDRYRHHQVKDFSANMMIKSSHMEVSKESGSIAAAPVKCFSNGGAATDSYMNGGLGLGLGLDLEELEPAQLMAPCSNVVHIKKPIIRLNFTSLAKSASCC